MSDVVSKSTVLQLELRIREAKESIPDGSVLIECYDDLCDSIMNLLEIWNTEGSRVRIGKLEILIEELVSQLNVVIEKINTLKSASIQETCTYSKKNFICYSHH